MVKSDEFYAAQTALKDAERELASEIRHGRPDYKIDKARKAVDAAASQYRKAERRG